MARESVRSSQSMSGTRMKMYAKLTHNLSAITEKKRSTVSITTSGSRPNPDGAKLSGGSVNMKRVRGSKTLKQKSTPAKNPRHKRRTGVKSLRRQISRSVKRNQTLSGTRIKKNAKRTGKLSSSTGKTHSSVSISTTGTRPQRRIASLSRRSVPGKRVR